MGNAVCPAAIGAGICESGGSTVEYRQLGRSGLRVSTLTLGTATFGGKGKLGIWGSQDVAEARRLIDTSVDAGVNLIDTADAYSDGLSEEILGEALQGSQADVLVATKARFATGPGPNDAGLSRHHLIAACEASLRRLRRDHIDLYQMHEWDGQTPLEETLSALDTLVQSGKVRYLGTSNYTGWQLMKAAGVAERRGFEPFVAQQIFLSLQSRDAEVEVMPAAIDLGLGTLVWSPLAGGLLSGKYRRGVTPEGAARHLGDWHEPPIYDEDRLYDTIDAIVEIADARGAAPSQVALAWLLGRPGITSLVIGARTHEQLVANLEAAELHLTAEEADALERVSRTPLPYPLWHQADGASDRLSPADESVLKPHLEP
jgi:aryl-alcohol dehydrogenase-like predicted oxidoreductase